MYLRTIAASVCLAASALLSLPISARAITFSLAPAGTTPAGAGSFSTVTGATLLNDFDPNITPDNPAATYTGGLVLNRTQTTTNYTPGGDTTNFLTTGSYYLGNNNFRNRQTASPVNITFNTPVDYFGLYWGLIDNGNIATVNTNRGSLRVTGDQVNRERDTNNYVNFTTDPGEFITSVVLQQAASGGDGFETDNHAFRSAAAVPFELSPTLGSLALVAWGVGIGLQRKLKNNPELLSRIMVK